MYQVIGFERFGFISARGICSMIIAIASGKGGTGKTTVATNLALAVRDMGYTVQFLDCDVEEPNAHIFLKPKILSQKKVAVSTPSVDKEKCTLCGKCGEVCQFSAITVMGGLVLTFPELCHGCGGCFNSCPEDAISEVGREVGVIERGTASGVKFTHGRLRISEAMSPPLIRAVKRDVNRSDVIVIDAPPGTSCPVIQSVKGSDYVLLVTEPTPFGLNDLKLAVEMVRELGITFGVVVNRAGMGGRMVNGYCDQEGIEIVSEFPDDRRIAEAYSRGRIIIEELPEYRMNFEHLFRDVQAAIRRQKTDDEKTWQRTFNETGGFS
ncbi:MAG: ATP-binding protein [bacterium]